MSYYQFKKGIYIYILETVIENIYKIGITEVSKDNSDSSRLKFLALNGHASVSLQRAKDIFQQSSGYTKKVLDKKLKDLIEDDHYDLFTKVSGSEIYLIKENNYEEAIQRIQSVLDGAVLLKKDVIQQINKDYFDDYKPLKTLKQKALIKNNNLSKSISKNNWRTTFDSLGVEIGTKLIYIGPGSHKNKETVTVIDNENKVEGSLGKMAISAYAKKLNNDLPSNGFDMFKKESDKKSIKSTYKK